MADRSTRDDIEKRLRALQGDAKDEVDNRKEMMLKGAAAAGIVMLIRVFLLGKRSGKRKTTLVEIRRV